MDIRSILLTIELVLEIKATVSASSNKRSKIHLRLKDKFYTFIFNQSSKVLTVKSNNSSTLYRFTTLGDLDTYLQTLQNWLYAFDVGTALKGLFKDVQQLKGQPNGKHAYLICLPHTKERLIFSWFSFEGLIRVSSNVDKKNSMGLLANLHNYADFVGYLSVNLRHKGFFHEYL